MDTTEVARREIQSVGPETIAIILETPPEFTAEPGQFVLVRRPSGDGDDETDGGDGRYYTISSPRVMDTFEITVGIDPDGTVSSWLAEREPGDVLVAEGPFGNVFYDGDGPVLALAGGPGIGPALAVAERAREQGHEAAVVYLDDEPVHERRLAALANDGVPVAIVSDEDAVADAIAPVVDTGRSYVFGFKSFCELALDAIEAAGGDPDAAEVESFG
jgi:ferredoxin-NADP reductase